MRSSENDVLFRPLREEEITRALFLHFCRRQRVTICLRNVGGEWREFFSPFTDDWNEEDYARLAECLRSTLQKGGAVFGAFSGGRLKGFASVEGEPLGFEGAYRELTSIHVSEDMRRGGIGKELFLRAKEWAKAQGAKKLYISSHPAVESQRFYRAMGCVDAKEIVGGRTPNEPPDRRLECEL